MALTKHKSASVSDMERDGAKPDRRVVRTRRQLDTAFVDLLHRRTYGNIRVSDITRKAGVGRATFYAHYSSKDDLLRSQFQRIVAPMLVTRPRDPCPLDASAFLAHVQAAPWVYRALMGPGAGGGPRVLRECFEQCVQHALMSGEENSRVNGACLDLQKAIVARFVASSLFAVIECFVESGADQSPQSLQKIFSGLVGGGLAVFRGPASEQMLDQRASSSH
jgi:AcrR family transcriptional regulator